MKTIFNSFRDCGSLSLKRQVLERQGESLGNVTSFFSYYRPYKHLFILDFSCAVVAALYFNAKMTKTYRGLFSALADFNSRVEENIGGIRVVQAFVNEGHEQKLFEENNNAYRATKLWAYKIMAGSLSINYMPSSDI